MAKRLTTEEFIRKAREVHGDKYDYSLVDYKNNSTKVKIIFDGFVYDQNPKSHLHGHLCEISRGRSNKLAKKQFVERAIRIYGDKYDYSLVEYVNAMTKVKIIYEGIIYEQTPSGHLRGYKCENGDKSKELFIRKARNLYGNKYDYSLVEYVDSLTNIQIIYNGVVYSQTPKSHLYGNLCELTTQNIGNAEFIKRAKEIHGDKYDYSLVEYVNRYTKIKIIFNGVIYEQVPYSHLNGFKCEPKVNNEKFIEKARQVHGDKFDYSLVEYVDKLTPIKIIYNNVIYTQVPIDHIKGASPNGTQTNISRGAKAIKKYLKANNILYIQEYSYSDCRNVNALRFDFYLPDYNILIEFDGKQHFFPIEYFGGEKTLESTKIRDSIKNEYCEKNRIPLLRIPYFEVNNIDKILEDFIFCCEHHL